MIKLSRYWGSKSPPEQVAAIDLGSNSFHMIVARLNGAELIILDRLRETVRLAAGLDASKRIDDAAQQRALACLQRFGQRIGTMPPGSVRAVGTNTLRSARNARRFLNAAESALGHPIEVIAGVEEARLIYLGVAHSTADDTRRRLVVDIGGGSTEFIIGERFEPLHMESLHMGCVNMTQRHFADGSITRKRWARAVLVARQELEPIQTSYRRLGWETAIGASGTIRAVQSVVHAAGWSQEGITLTAIRQLGDAIVKAGHIGQLALPGLAADRGPVFPGGVAVLLAAFEALGIERMQVSDGALREGLLYDLLGRIRHEDVRARSVGSLAQRYHVDREQAERVAQTAVYCLDQVARGWELEDGEPRQLLSWAAQLHEIGLDIAHSQYHKHGAYVVENADMLGFSRPEQKLLAALIRVHRRKFTTSVFGDLPDEWRQPLLRLAILLRLAALLHRSRAGTALPPFTLTAGKKSVELRFPDGWIESQPLTQADLAQEAEMLNAAGYRLRFQ